METPWPAMCEAVLRLDRTAPAKAATGPGTASSTGMGLLNEKPRLLDESRRGEW
jgi:hypothetical protein